jgi:predicted transcriptional regulator
MSMEAKVKIPSAVMWGCGGIMLKKMKDEIELLSRHLEVAMAVTDHQPIGIMKLAELLDLPSHRIRYSLHVLEQLGYIRASPEGAIATALTEELFAHLNEDLDELIRLLEMMKRE